VERVDEDEAGPVVTCKAPNPIEEGALVLAPAD